MPISNLLDRPFYGSSSGVAAAEVPGRYHIGLAGVGYMLDLQIDHFYSRDLYQHESVPLLRQQADNSGRPSEASLNPDDLWRRSAETWHAGAGQVFYDKQNFSIDGRYHTSEGIDPWTQGQISLLPATDVVLSSANTNLALAVAGTQLYAIDGTALKRLGSLTFPGSWVTVTGTGSGNPTSIASDGYHVWAAYSDDLYYTTRGTGTSPGGWAASAQAGVTLVRYAKGRLFTAVGAALYNLGALGAALPSALYTHPNSDWAWTDICEGPNAIYLSGFSGSYSAIYTTTIKTDGTALDAPVQAAQLPLGETVKAVCCYLGFLLIGTNKGVRFATLASNGQVATIGDLVPTDDTVRDFEPQDRFVWYTGTTGGGSSSLGRLDLSTINGTRPAYANDLAVAGSHVPATGVVTFGGKRVFATAQGVYAETSDRVLSGSVTSGKIGYGLSDLKTALQVLTRYGAGSGSFAVGLSVDDGPLIPLGPPTAIMSAGGTTLAANLQGELAELTLTLYRSADDTTQGPVFRRWTLRSSTATPRECEITLPLLLGKQVVDLQGQVTTFDPVVVRENMKALCDSGQIISFQEGEAAYDVRVLSYHWVPYGPEWEKGPAGNWSATLAVKVGTV